MQWSDVTHEHHAKTAVVSKGHVMPALQGVINCPVVGAMPSLVVGTEMHTFLASVDVEIKEDS